MNGFAMPYKILSLDGGGAWALIQVRALTAMFGAQARGREVLGQFDLAAANSGGSLVLGGLLADFTLEKLLGLFQDETRRKTIFSPTKSWLRYPVRWIAGVGPKYSTSAKLPAIGKVMGDVGAQSLSETAKGIRRSGAKTDIHLLIVGYDYDRNRAKFFRSQPTGEGDPTALGEGKAAVATLAEAIHASTNAPVNYFDAPAAFPQQPNRYWDGAITGCNNPVLAAVAEAILLGQPPTDIAALSLGTGATALAWPQSGEKSPYVTDPTQHDLVNDLQKLAKSILADPPNIADFYAHLMTGCGAGLPKGKSRIVRMNPMVAPVRKEGKWTAPEGMSEQEFVYLKNLDMDAVEQRQVDAISRFADLWLTDKVPNQPLRMDGDTLRLEMGDPWFTSALASWTALDAA
jgi:uncharacterized protein